MFQRKNMDDSTKNMDNSTKNTLFSSKNIKKTGKKLAFRPIFLYLCNQQEKFLPIPPRSSRLLWNHNSNLKTRWAYDSSRFSKTLFRQRRKSQHMDLLLQPAMSPSPAMRTLSIRDLQRSGAHHRLRRLPRCLSRFLRHSQIFEQLFVLINTKEVFWNIQALKYR